MPNTEQIVPVDVALVDALPPLGADVDAAVLAGRGLLYRLGGGWLVLRRVEPPEVSVATLRVLACDEQFLSPGVWPSLVTGLLERFAVERLLLRSALPSERLERLDLAVFLHFVSKTARPSPAEGVEILPARWPDDHDYVAGLMCESLQSGMPHVRFSEEQLKVYVDGYLRLGQPDGCEAVITVVDGERVGTAVYRPETDELTTTPFTRLVDIMTGRRGRGHGWRIAPAFETHVASSAHLPDLIVGTVVGEADGSDRQIIERLTKVGWAYDHTWWAPRMRDD